MGLSGGFPTGAALDDTGRVDVPDKKLVVVCSGACEEDFVARGSLDGVSGVQLGVEASEGFQPFLFRRVMGPLGPARR